VWVGSSRLASLELTHLRHLGHLLERIPAPRFAAASGRIEPRNGLVVYPGGRR
jgi:hypothetical protein